MSESNIENGHFSCLKLNNWLSGQLPFSAEGGVDMFKMYVIYVVVNVCRFRAKVSSTLRGCHVKVDSQSQFASEHIT